MWNGSKYESRMTFEGEKLSPSYKVVNAFKDRGFDRVVFLDIEGKDINYTGDGHKDGASLALWISSRISGMGYYVPIPFYKYQSNDPRDNLSKSFANSYWKDWIDGVLSISDSNRLGFYWDYESRFQKEEEFIKEMSSYIHNHEQEVIWIPSTGTSDVDSLKNSAIPVISKYFDYVFVQPNYYEYNSDYTYEKLVEKVRWVYEELPKKIREHNPNSTTTVSIEMEADRTVLGIHCTSPGDCPEGMNCDSSIHTCYEHCRDHNPQKAINYALDYVRALKEIDWKPSNLAYYFSTDFKVIDTLQEQCRRELNEPYV